MTASLGAGFLQETNVELVSTNILYIADQMESRLLPTVQTTSFDATVEYFDVYGSRDPQIITTRVPPSPDQATPRGSRAIRLVGHHDGEFVDTREQIDSLNDPTGPIVKAIGAGMGRRVDKVIIDAAIGAAETGRQTPTFVNLPALNAIAINNHEFDAGSGNVGLTPGKLRAARSRFGKNKVIMNNGEKMHIVCTQTQIEDLLTSVEVQSADYNIVKALVDGQVNSFLNFEFHVVSPDLLPYVAGTTTRTVVCYTPDAIMFAFNPRTNTQIGPRPDFSYRPYVYFERYMGASRFHEQKVVTIACLETA